MANNHSSTTMYILHRIRLASGGGHYYPIVDELVFNTKTK